MGREDEGPIHTHSELSCPGCGVEGCRERYVARPPEEDESPLPYAPWEWAPDAKGPNHESLMRLPILDVSDDPQAYLFAEDEDD